MFGMEKWTKPQKKEGADMTNVVDMAPVAEAPVTIVRDSMGNPVGTAGSAAEAREKQIQANIDAREAA
jgi:hypothetical protein